MNEKKLVGIRRDRFINLMQETLGITDPDIVNKTYDKMILEKKTMSEFFTPILVNHLKNTPGISGDIRNGDLDYLIGEFEIIINPKKKDQSLTG